MMVLQCCVPIKKEQFQEESHIITEFKSKSQTLENTNERKVTLKHLMWFNVLKQ